MKEKVGTSSSLENSAVKAGVWYTISSIATKAVLIFTTPIFTRLLSTEDYGIAATFTSWYSLLMVFCTLNLTYSIGRAKIDYKDNLERYVGAIQLLSACFTLVLVAVALVFAEKLVVIMGLNKKLLYCLAVYLFFYPSVEFKQALYKYRYQYKGNIKISAFITLSTIVCTFAFIFLLNDQRYYGRILGTVVPTAMLGLLFWGQFLKDKKININTTYWKYGLTISVPLILNTVSLQIMAQSDRIMITKFFDTSLTGIYTLAYQYATLINIVLDAIGRAWLPWFHDTYAKGNLSDIRKNVKPLIAFGCVMGIGCISLAPEAIFILGGEKYMEGQWVVAPLVLGIVCRYIFVQFEHIELHVKKTQYTAMGTVIAAILNLILNLIFIPRYGFIAAAYTTLFSYFVLMVIHYVVTAYIMKIKLYDVKFMYFAFIASVLITFILLGIYENIVFRLLLDMIVCGFYFMHYKGTIMMIFNKNKKVRRERNE